MSKTTDYDAIVIGAGYSGIRSLWELDRLGLTSKCFDAASDIGGTWYWNGYPGSRTDGEAWVYLLNFAPELLEEWKFKERYPTRDEIQDYLGRIVDRCNLRKNIQFDTKVASAHFSDSDNTWTVTTVDGKSATCRYFITATGILSVPNDPPFPGLKTYTGEWYQAAKWPKHEVDFKGKSIAIVGTGSTGVHLVPKLAPIAKELTVFQHTPNYVLPGRNYMIDEYQAAEVKYNHDATWQMATENIAGHAFRSSGRTVKGTDPEKIRQILDNGWEQSNEVVSEFIRQKIRAIVQDPVKAEMLCPRYPFGAKRPPSGHHYFETFNRSNVHLVDVSKDEIVLYEKGIRLNSGVEHEFDMIIFAIGFDAGTGAMNNIDIRGSNSVTLRDYWSMHLETLAGVLVHGFPNMFIVCGPHMPAGNQPTFLEISADWVGKTIRHMEENQLATINVSKKAAQTWSEHVEGLWNMVFISKPATENRSWFVGTNIPGKPAVIMFYFGGIPNWRPWLDNEVLTKWASMEFMPRVINSVEVKGAPSQATSDSGILTSQISSIDGVSTAQDILKDGISAVPPASNGGVATTAEDLESATYSLQSDEAGISAAEKFNIVTAACARYIDWAVKKVNDKGLTVQQDYRVNWWKTLEDFVNSEPGKTFIEQAPSTKDELDELTSQLGVEGEAIAHIGPELTNMLTGKTNPLHHILKDDLLFRIYSADEGVRPNRYVADNTKILTSEKKDLRILEIGAGTGGTTLQVFRACSPNSEPFCKEYMYTDISNGFFKTGENALKQWSPLLTFKTLNIENDPVKQGFEEHAYDLVITANCIHATSSLNDTLRNIHTLVKPGGVLGLVELTRLTPYFNIAFGPLEGWWAGAGEGRTESPLQSVEQWSRHLKVAGFTGVDVAAYDLPEPERHSALMLSTALAVGSVTNGPLPPPPAT